MQTTSDVLARMVKRYHAHFLRAPGTVFLSADIDVASTMAAAFPDGQPKHTRIIIIPGVNSVGVGDVHT